MVQRYAVAPILLGLAFSSGCSQMSSPGVTTTPVTAYSESRNQAGSDATDRVGPSSGPGVDNHVGHSAGDPAASRAGGDIAMTLAADVAQQAPHSENPSELRAKARPKSLEDVKGLSGYDEVNSKSQPSASFESVEGGKALYSATCARCHGAEGKPQDDSGTLGRYNMANLSDPMQYKYGADGRGIYRSLAFGTAAPPHGMYKEAYTESQLWNLVSYVQTLQH